MKNETSQNKIKRIVEEYAKGDLSKQILAMELEVLVVTAQLEFIQKKQ